MVSTIDDISNMATDLLLQQNEFRFHSDMIRIIAQSAKMYEVLQGLVSLPLT